MIGIQGANPNFVDDVQARTETASTTPIVMVAVADPLGADS